MIEGIEITALRKIPDERGTIFHVLRTKEDNINKLGEVYLSKIYPSIIKGWHLHKVMTLRYTVVSGMIKLVLYDARPKSPTKGEVQEIYMGDENYVRVTVPPLVWNGFKGIGVGPALVLNCPSHSHSKEEIEYMDPIHSTIPYTWDTVMR